jgi:Fe-S cluster assembly scaffold protein SufB
MATQSNDVPVKYRVIQNWEKMFHAKGLTQEYVTCDGCHAMTGRLCGHYAECKIRACGISKGIQNRAFCNEFETCELIQGVIGNVTVARQNLETIRSNHAEGSHARTS